MRRIAVKARESGTRPDWIVFALTNDTDEQVDRLLVAPHFRLTGSGVVWPDLGSTRIEAITASQGIRPERDDSPGRGHLPDHPRSRHDRHVRGRTCAPPNCRNCSSGTPMPTRTGSTA